MIFNILDIKFFLILMHPSNVILSKVATFCQLFLGLLKYLNSINFLSSGSKELMYPSIYCPHIISIFYIML